jgi:hypothetical protein
MVTTTPQNGFFACQFKSELIDRKTLTINVQPPLTGPQQVNWR